MPLQPLTPLEIAIYRMEQQVQALMMEIKQMKAFAAEQKEPQAKRDLVFLFGKGSRQASMKNSKRKTK